MHTPPVLYKKILYKKMHCLESPNNFIFIYTLFGGTAWFLRKVDSLIRHVRFLIQYRGCTPRSADFQKNEPISIHILIHIFQRSDFAPKLYTSPVLYKKMDMSNQTVLFFKKSSCATKPEWFQTGNFRRFQTVNFLIQYFLIQYGGCTFIFLTIKSSAQPRVWGPGDKGL